MARFPSVYTDEQREAVEHALLDRLLTVPATVQTAANGELLHPSGKRLVAFKLNTHSARDMKRTAQRRRAGKLATDMAKLPPRDAIDALRRRLLSASDLMLRDWEKTAKRDPSNADPERLRQIARAARECAALAGPPEGRPLKPGGRANGERNGAVTNPNGTLAGSILADSNRTNGSPDPAQRVPTQAKDTSHAHQDTGHTDTDSQAVDGLATQQSGSRIASLSHGL